jgi:hypothetical protein
MFRAQLGPSSGEQDCEQLHVVFSTGCAGQYGAGRKLCAHSSRPAPHSLVLLMMGIIVPETC